MLTKTMSRKPGRVLAVFAIAVWFSELAQAQQSGLFPLHPIRRQRVPCPHEDPVYKLYRHQYFGYHPTVWRRFPEGWGFPSPEAANPKLEFEKLPIEPPRPEGMDEEDEGEEAVMPRGRAPLPTPPPETERSPFEMDRPDAEEPDAGEPEGGRPLPPRRNGLPPAGRSPFEELEPGAEPPLPVPGGRPRTGATGAPSVPPPAPALDLPADAEAQAGRTGMEEWDEADRGVVAIGNGPLLGLPEAGLPAIEEPGSFTVPSLPETSIPAAPALATALPREPALAGSAPTPAPRRGRLSSFFAGLGRNRLWR